MNSRLYEKASKYHDLKHIYSQCAGPGGLKVTEYIADKMNIKPGKKLLDIGVFLGCQTCFLAGEYNLFTVGIDPWDYYYDGRPHIDYLTDNAKRFNVDDKVLGIKVGVPDTLLPANSFDYAYSTTTFEMIRGMDGKEKYLECLREVYRILKPGGIFGLGEPMHFDMEIPSDILPFVSDEWRECFGTIEETLQAVKAVGFTVLESGYAEDAQDWWNEYAQYTKFSSNEFEEKKTIEMNNNRWLSFGFVIAQK